MEINEKRPERVLQKGMNQDVVCPSCSKVSQVSNDRMNVICSCGQALNWALRK